MKDLHVRLSDVSAVVDPEPVGKRIGLVLLSTDHTTEREFNHMVPADRVGVYGTRVEYANPTTPENLRKMGPGLAAAAALILPGERLDAIVYACTSGSIAIGDLAIAAAFAAVKPGMPVVTPVTAARDALHALGARRISMLTPYLLDTSRPMAEHFSGLGFDVLNLDCFGFEDDRQMARIRPDSIVEAACKAAQEDADALFISCTALRAAGVAAEIEDRIGKPVVTSNQACVWRALRHCGIEDAIPGYGRLLELSVREA